MVAHSGYSIVLFTSSFGINLFNKPRTIATNFRDRVMNNKKAFIFSFANPIVLILLGILLLLILLSFLGVAFFIKANAFVLLGIFLVVIGGVGILMKSNPSIAFGLIAGGVVLMLFPMLFKEFGGITLASMLS